VLVNCAGIGVAKRVIGREGPMALADFDKVIKINLIGSFNMLRLATTACPSSNHWRPASACRDLHRIGWPPMTGRSGSGLFGLEGRHRRMTLPIARELAQFGIRVLTIAPGLFMTPLLGSLPQEAQDSLAAAIPFPRRLGQPTSSPRCAAH